MSHDSEAKILKYIGNEFKLMNKFCYSLINYYNEITINHVDSFNIIIFTIIQNVRTNT